MAFSGACAVCLLQVWGLCSAQILTSYQNPRELASDLVVTRVYNGQLKWTLQHPLIHSIRIIHSTVTKQWSNCTASCNIRPLLSSPRMPTGSCVRFEFAFESGRFATSHIARLTTARSLQISCIDWSLFLISLALALLTRFFLPRVCGVHDGVNHGLKSFV